MLIADVGIIEWSNANAENSHGKMIVQGKKTNASVQGIVIKSFNLNENRKNQPATPTSTDKPSTKIPNTTPSPITTTTGIPFGRFFVPYNI